MQFLMPVHRLMISLLFDILHFLWSVLCTFSQVAVLASTCLNKKPREIQKQESAFPYYTRLKDKNNTLPNLLSIHPDSQLYPLAVIARNPPPAVLFIEAVDADANNTSFEKSHHENAKLSSCGRRVLMRHVCAISSDWLADAAVSLAPQIRPARKRSLSEPTPTEDDNQSTSSNTILDSSASPLSKKRRRRNRKNKKNRLASTCNVVPTTDWNTLEEEFELQNFRQSWLPTMHI